MELYRACGEGGGKVGFREGPGGCPPTLFQPHKPHPPPPLKIPSAAPWGNPARPSSRSGWPQIRHWSWHGRGAVGTGWVYGCPLDPPSIILHTPPPKHPKNAGCGFLGSSPFPYLPVEVGVQQHDGTRQGVHGIWRGARGGVRVGVSSPPQVRTPVTVNPSGCSWGCPKALGGDGWGN